MKQSRFTEETPSFDPAAKLSLLLEPSADYWIYDVLAETVGTRRSDDAGRLEIFLAGRSVRLLYVLKAADAPRLIFSTCERRDGSVHSALPAKLYAHRPGSAVVTAIPDGARVMLDGKPAPVRETDSCRHRRGDGSPGQSHAHRAAQQGKVILRERNASQQPTL